MIYFVGKFSKISHVDSCYHWSVQSSSSFFCEYLKQQTENSKLKTHWSVISPCFSLFVTGHRSSTLLADGGKNPEKEHITTQTVYKFVFRPGDLCIKTLSVLMPSRQRPLKGKYWIPMQLSSLPCLFLTLLCPFFSACPLLHSLVLFFRGSLWELQWP